MHLSKLFIFQDNNINLDDEVYKIQQAAPFIVTTGIAGEEQFQIFICAEQSVILESKSVKDALIDLMAAYFVFDISYPKYLDSVLIFIQHYVFDLKDQQPLPSAAVKLVGNLEKL